MPTQLKGKKRTAPQPTKPNKKLKTSHGGKAKKERAFERPTIPVPMGDDDDEVSEEDIQFYAENEGARMFLRNLDTVGITRSKKETERLFELTKVPYKTKEIKNNVLSLGSSGDDEDNSDWNSSIEYLGNSDHSDEGIEAPSSSAEDSEQERTYERKLQLKNAQEDEKRRKFVPRLPIKLPSGQIEQTGVREGSMKSSEDEDEDEDEERAPMLQEMPRSDVAGARFGRKAVGDVVAIKNRSHRIQAAKEQIAGICQEILSEPEASLGLLRRLMVFASPTIIHAKNSGETKMKNDPVIQQLSVLSLMAVFKDIAPGYRIRKLTEKETKEKVSQAVGRTREWEQGLVAVYQSYLLILEREIREKTELGGACIKCMCSLLQHLTHFNFRTNIMSTLVACLSRKSWDSSSQECLDTLIYVFKHDLTGTPSLEAVRLLNRMIKERHYSVHPNVLNCLLHLRLKTELNNIRASSQYASKDGMGRKNHSESKAKLKRAKGKGKGETPHLSKKAKKALKETKAIQAELDEAEAEVDREERINQQTETLKILFVLYFSILKAARPSPLLFSALQGIAKFAHLVNIDFFRDLLEVIREIMRKVEAEREDGEERGEEDQLRLQLACIVTAFDLLGGQGESLNLDLDDFTNHLYKLLPRLAATPAFSEEESTSLSSETLKVLLFRVLHAILLPKYSKPPSHQLYAFSKRLLSLSLHTPSAITLRILELVKILLGKEPKLEGLFNMDERAGNGLWREDVDDLMACNPFAAVGWEILVLEESHVDERVRESARALRTFRVT